MAIVKRIRFLVMCDRCGYALTDSQHRLGEFRDVDIMRAVALARGWVIDNGKWYHGKCYKKVKP